MAFMRKIVLSLGGSLIVPSGVDVAFLKDFRDAVAEETRKGTQFFIVCGGGKVARDYRDAAQKLGTTSPDALDWIGIYATRFNAELLRTTFEKLAHPKVISAPSELGNPVEPVIVGGGTKPGHSSDFAAVEMAKHIGATTLINLSNIDYVYEKDPRKFPDAKKVERATWKEFRAILPPVETWTPGMNAPFDPVAAAEAEKSGLEVIIMNGKPLEHLKNYLEGKEFKGTVVRS